MKEEARGQRKLGKPQLLTMFIAIFFLVRLSSGRLESFRYVQFFSDDDERVRIYDSKRKKT